MKTRLPRQKSFLQPRVSSFTPTQSLLPFTGFGLLQSRVLICTPPPHVAEQILKSDHSLKPPSDFQQRKSRVFTCLQNQ